MGKRMDRLIMVALALALGYFAFDKFVLDPARDTELARSAAQQARSEALVESYGENSIAVLPFVNMSSDPEQEYFADGIAEELLNLLAKIPELRVISRSSAFSFKGQNVEIPEIAERLNVAHILEGSVRKSGDRIRITAQLIEARSDTHLWSETYDRTLVDIFATQDEIAAEVVKQLRIVLLGPAPETRRTNPQAYALTLQAKNIVGINNRDTVEKMYSLAEQALELDPDYIPALHTLAMANYQRMTDGLISKQDSKRLHLELMQRVLDVDPDDGVAHAYLAWTAFEEDRDLETAAAGLRQAVRYEPGNGEVLRLAGAFARYIGRFDEAIDILERAAVRDPLCFGCLWELSKAFVYAGRLDEAEAVRRKLIGFGTGGQYSLGVLMLMKGDPEAALEIFDGDELDESRRDVGRAMVLHDLGKEAELKVALAGLVEEWGEKAPDLVADAFAWSGDKDAAFGWIDKAFGPEPNRFFRLIFSPVWHKLHGDPRWTELRENAGMSAERLAAIEFDIELTDETPGGWDQNPITDNE
jgi:TolB-like protein/cytochrome c-type biogenesis protein CcmH/NrfG